MAGLANAALEFQEDQYVDVRWLPLRPPQPMAGLANAALEFEEDQYVDVRRLPLRPPQPLVPPAPAARRPWHPVVWDTSIIGIPPPQPQDDDEMALSPSREYPHKQRIRNLRRLIQQGKVKPTSETLIFFLCNKFAVSDDRKGNISV